jgi:hypothetical protein
MGSAAGIPVKDSGNGAAPGVDGSAGFPDQIFDPADELVSSLARVRMLSSSTPRELQTVVFKPG